MSVRKNTKNYNIYSFILYFAVIVFAILLMHFVLRITSEQTISLGNQQLETMSKEVDALLNHAVYEVEALADNVERLRIESDDSREAIEKFITEQSELQKELSDGQCFRVCYTRPQCIIVPGEEITDDFDISEREWYIQALKMGTGGVYISSPYLDFFKNDFCFTVAKVLSDGITTVSLDYTMASLQQYFIQIPNDNGSAILVNSDGLIVSANIEGLNGASLEEAIPQIARSWNRIKHVSNGNGSFRQGLYNYFYNVTENGAYLIYSVNIWQLHGRNLVIMILIILFLLFVFLLIIMLLAKNRSSRKLAEEALHSKDLFFENLKAEFENPLVQINQLTKDKTWGKGEVESNILKIRESSLHLQQLFDNLIAYSAIQSETENQDKTENKEEKEVGEVDNENIKKMELTLKIILIVLIPVVIIFMAFVVRRQGRTVMNYNTETYYGELQAWVSSRKNSIDMMANMLEAKPEILNSYEDCVNYLNDIANEYEGISLIYVGNEELKHPIIMSDGWAGNGNYILQAYSWYSNAKNSREGYELSTVHYDIDSQQYVITFSKRMTDKYGNFLGVLGVDFNVSDLVAALESEYTDDEYAFLVTKTGAIMNHPYSEYKISYSDTVSMDESVYKGIQDEEGIRFLWDYDNRLVVASHREESVSGFQIYVIRSWMSVYGAIFLSSLIFFILINGSILLIFMLWRKINNWRRRTNEELADAVSEAYNANQAKTRFLAQMSHEIRTPINAILGMNEMISRESNDASVLEHSKDIKESGKMLLLLVNSILDFAKIENGKDEIVFVKYNTREMISGLISEISPLASEHNLELKTEISDNIPSVLYGDKVKIVQIIINLLTNAVKYTPEGSITFKMTSEETAEGRISLGAHVIDTGIGIKDEDREKLFESFQRLDMDKNHNIEGTGLGLYIVRHFLEEMGSDLKLNSVYGEGSEFYFYVEQDVIDSTPIGSEDLFSDINDTEKNATYMYAPKAKVVVVDDNEMNRKVARELLKRSEMHVELCESGAELLERIDSLDVDLVLLDQMMPGLSGDETLKQIRDNNLLPANIPIIIMTAHAIAGAKEQYIAMGFDDYLSKPINPVELENTLMKWLPNDLYETRKVEAAASKEKAASKKGTGTANKGAADSVSSNAVAVKDPYLIKLIERIPELDVQSGLSTCSDSEEFYIEVVKMFANMSIKDELCNFYSSNDFRNYCIAIHGFKNNAYSIGLSQMGDWAFEMEEMSRNSFESGLEDVQSKLFTEYDRICELINAE